MVDKLSTSEFRFAPTDTIGAAGAEDDREALKECFVDTGLLGLLRDMRDGRLIVLGRTGAGKSALLAALEDAIPDRVIRVSPEQLALTYVANSTVLNFFASIGVNLDPFLKLLWRHVLTVEILSRHFANDPGPHEPSFVEKLKIRFLGPSKKGLVALAPVGRDGSTQYHAGGCAAEPTPRLKSIVGRLWDEVKNGLRKISVTR